MSDITHPQLVAALVKSPVLIATTLDESKIDLIHAIMGISGEAGELLDAIKKHVIYGEPLDKVNVMEECADIFWYLNLFMVEKGCDLNIVDDTAGQFQLSKAELERMADKDSFALVELSLAISAMVSTLILPEDERGVSDKKVIFTTVVILQGLLEYCDYTLSQALETNIKKLVIRHGDKYSDYNALNRDTDSERTVLEGASAGGTLSTAAAVKVVAGSADAKLS